MGVTIESFGPPLFRAARLKRDISASGSPSLVTGL